jgi:hypothetical protein
VSGVPAARPECWNLDFDDGGTVDLDDYAAFQLAFTGSP